MKKKVEKKLSQFIWSTQRETQSCKKFFKWHKINDIYSRRKRDKKSWQKNVSFFSHICSWLEGKKTMLKKGKREFQFFFCQKTFWAEKITLKKNNFRKTFFGSNCVLSIGLEPAFIAYGPRAKCGPWKLITWPQKEP